jgi:hypothetical protein
MPAQYLSLLHAYCTTRFRCVAGLLGPSWCITRGGLPEVAIARLLHAGTRTDARENERWDWSKDAWRKSDWGGDGDELRRMVVLSLDKPATRPKRLHLMLVDSG